MESVNDLAQVEQIAESAEAVCCHAVNRRRTVADVIFLPVGPLCGNERAAAVGQAHKQKQNAAPPNAADHRQGHAFEGMALANDRHRIRNITAMGSLEPLPSTTSATSG